MKMLSVAQFISSNITILGEIRYLFGGNELERLIIVAKDI